MKKPSLKYVGDRSVRALLARYACPIPFHAVRTRFLGNIATPKLDASPVQTIKSLWGGDLPEFDDMVAVNELFEALMSLWNALAKHQSGTNPYRLARMAVTPDPDDLRRVCRTRTEELEGFIDGLFGDEEVIDLPERANEALDHLGEINAMMHGILSSHGKRVSATGVGTGLGEDAQGGAGALTHRGEGASRAGAVLHTSTPTGARDHRGGQADDPLTGSPPTDGGFEPTIVDSR